MVITSRTALSSTLATNHTHVALSTWHMADLGRSLLSLKITHWISKTHYQNRMYKSSFIIPLTDCMWSLFYFGYIRLNKMHYQSEKFDLCLFTLLNVATRKCEITHVLCITFLLGSSVRGHLLPLNFNGHSYPHLAPQVSPAMHCGFPFSWRACFWAPSGSSWPSAQHLVTKEVAPGLGPWG